jgi:hypothetical protein
MASTTLAVVSVRLPHGSQTYANGRASSLR